ncbi:hypothetical protein ARTSIC4J27_216 [Pseudarthrobacter siccitolerans]|uniref:Holliday junction resolvase n=1 Tax=Pseudarthrobacter siccitolerans TaxID=861266 RepID=A0A024GXD6_9MICC|nr:hypothetical protein [Pseudarthrobacter siccitolerans]CCQ44292.1 hypothetical protein ARTSIC4J27_216 [Pseudarthrobacter siccitolerans]
MSAAKAKGTKWETDLKRSLTAFFGGRFGLAPRRVAQEGFTDSGDIQGISPFVGQAKNYKSWEDAIRLGLDGAEKQKIHAGEPYGVAFIKRIRKPVGGGYAVMTVATWARVLLRLRRAESYLREASPYLYRKHSAECESDAEGDFPRG